MLLSCGILSALWAVLFGVRSGVALSYLLCGVGVAQEPTPLFLSGTVQVVGSSLESRNQSVFIKKP